MFGVPLQTSDTSRGPYYAGTPPAGVTRQLPGRESVPLWSLLQAWRPSTCVPLAENDLRSWGGGERSFSIPLFPLSLWWKGKKRVSFLQIYRASDASGEIRKLCIFVFYHKGSFLFHFPVSAENRAVHTMIWQMTSKTYEALTLAAWTWARCFELRTRLQPQ